MSADEIDNTKCRREELISGGDGGGPVDAPPPPPSFVTSRPPHPSLGAQNGYYTLTRESVRTSLMRNSYIVCFRKILGGGFQRRVCCYTYDILHFCGMSNAIRVLREMFFCGVSYELQKGVFRKT